MTLPSLGSSNYVRCAWVSLILAVPAAQAFVAPTGQSRPRRHNIIILSPTPHNILSPTPQSIASQSTLFASDGEESLKQFSHSDVEWKLRPPEDSSRLQRLKFKLGANILRLDSKLRGSELPSVLCPRGGRALLEAYYKGEKSHLLHYWVPL